MDPKLILIAVGVLAGVAAFTLGAALLLAWGRQRETVQARRRVMNRGGADDQEEKDSRAAGFLASVGYVLSGGGFSRKLEQSLNHAGFHGSHPAAIYLGYKVLLLGLGIAGGVALYLFAGLALVPTFLVGALLTLLLFLLPNLVVSSLRSRRRGEIQRRLPDAVDLLEVCVTAGMGLDMAWDAVTEEIRKVSRILSDEMELTRLEISLGIPRTDAMRHMSERTGADEISSLVALLVQSERFGASIAEALSTFAHSMRDIQSRRAEESAEKMAVKMLFPMVLFIFPALLIVMVGPAVMNIVDVML